MAKRKSILGPRQTKFLTYYVDPKSETYANALQSALKAGFAQEYAESLTYQLPDWLSDSLGTNKMLVKAERNLDEFLDLETTETRFTKNGDEYEKTNTEILKVKADVTKFVASTVGKAKYNPKEAEQVPQHQTVVIINYGNRDNAPVHVRAQGVSNTAS
jgi:hypothetical protein